MKVESEETGSHPMETRSVARKRTHREMLEDALLEAAENPDVGIDLSNIDA